MKIAIISDFHFGFGRGTEREEDPYDSVSEALDKAEGADIILVPGDLFDSKNPDAGVLSRAMEVLQKPLFRKSSAMLSGFVGDKSRESVSEMPLMGTPVVAIHGTHERRVKGLMNPVQALEKAGFLIYLHCNGVIFEKEGEKVCVQGLSGVPDQYAESVIKEWGPTPVEEAFNIFVLHQSITELMYAEKTIDLNALPGGFDLYVNGHIHDPKVSGYSGKPLIIPGSLIPTQLREEEAGRGKGFFVFDTETGKEERFNLENQRMFYFVRYSENFEEEMNKIIRENGEKKPIVRVSFPEGTEPSEISDIETRFSDSVILSLKRESGKKKEFDTKTLEEHKLSVEELGKKLLTENLEKEGLDPRSFGNLFALLSEGKMEEARKELERIPVGEKKKQVPEETKEGNTPENKNEKPGHKQRTLV